jgi:hypothetical protein
MARQAMSCRISAGLKVATGAPSIFVRVIVAPSPLTKR